MFVLPSSLPVILLALSMPIIWAQEETCNPTDYVFPEGIFSFVAGDPGMSVYTAITSRITAGVEHQETPIALRIFSQYCAAAWNCVAAYSNSKLDALRSGQRPIVQVPERACDGQVKLHTTDTRAQCFINLHAAAIPTVNPESLEGFQNAMSFLSSDFSSGFPPKYSGAFPVPYPMGMPPEVEACGKEEDYEVFKTCVNQVATNHHYRPRIVGAIIAMDMIKYGKDDGFNADGTNEGTCEHNCRPYGDTIGYTPINHPGMETFMMQNLSYLNHWRPLLEDDGNGFFYRQEHVTPHIGFKAKPRLLTREEIDQRTISVPYTNYAEEAEKVIKRMSQLDDVKKMKVEFFDNKVNLVILYSTAVLNRYARDFSFEHGVLFAAAYGAAEHDAVLLAWKEKVRHDRVRTTTVIQDHAAYGTPETITTWGGPFQGVSTFKAREFQPYIRTMPHSEFPSGSGCICQAEMDATHAFMKTVYNETIQIDDESGGFYGFAEFQAGSSKTEPGMTPSKYTLLEYTTLQQVRDDCGESRLDGGMHFFDSVPTSYELCQGFGPKAESFILTLLNGTTDLYVNYIERSAGDTLLFGPEGEQTPGVGGGGGGPPPGVGGGGGGPPPGVGGGGGGPPPGVGGSSENGVDPTGEDSGESPPPNDSDTAGEQPGSEDPSSGASRRWRLAWL